MILTIEDLEVFYEQHCRGCGTQRCGSVYDKETREGCMHYQKAAGTYKKSNDNLINNLNADDIKEFSEAYARVMKQ